MTEALVLRQSFGYEVGAYRRWFQVKVHPSFEHLLSATRRMGRPVSEDCRACYHPNIQGHPHGNPHVGVIRFARGWINAEVVTHEVTHAALDLYRLDVNGDVRLGRAIRRNEERLAYLLGDLVSGTNLLLHEANLWD